MRKPLTTSQCVVLALFWAALCFHAQTPYHFTMCRACLVLGGTLLYCPYFQPAN